jgi:hypothetical protein
MLLGCLLLSVGGLLLRMSVLLGMCLSLMLSVGLLVSEGTVSTGVDEVLDLGVHEPVRSWGGQRGKAEIGRKRLAVERRRRWSK